MDSKGNDFFSHEIGNGYYRKHSKNGALATFCTIFGHIAVSQAQLAPMVKFITFWVNISDSVAHAVKANAPCQETRPVVSWLRVFLFSSTRVTGYPEIILRDNIWLYRPCHCIKYFLISNFCILITYPAISRTFWRGIRTRYLPVLQCLGYLS